MARLKAREKQLHSACYPERDAVLPSAWFAARRGRCKPRLKTNVGGRLATQQGVVAKSIHFEVRRPDFSSGGDPSWLLGLKQYTTYFSEFSFHI